MVVVGGGGVQNPAKLTFKPTNQLTQQLAHAGARDVIDGLTTEVRCSLGHT